MTELSVKFGVQIPGGPTLQGDRKIDVETHQKIDLALPPNKSGTAQIDVDFLPEGSEEKINLLLIQSTLYSENLSYSIEGTNLIDIQLIEPLLLLGSDLIEKIAMPSKITFKNSNMLQDGDAAALAKQTAQITVLVGRAAPPAEEDTEGATETETETETDTDTNADTATDAKPPAAPVAG